MVVSAERALLSTLRGVIRDDVPGRYARGESAQLGHGVGTGQANHTGFAVVSRDGEPCDSAAYRVPGKAVKSDIVAMPVCARQATRLSAVWYLEAARPSKTHGEEAGENQSLPRK